MSKRKATTISIKQSERESTLCHCVDPDALTCLARTHNMSRFNAMLVFGGADIDTAPGYCPCLCHRKKARTA